MKALPHLDGGFYRPAADGVHVASYTDHGLDLVNERTGTISPVRDARKIRPSSTPGSWRPDGRRFVLGTADGYVQVFDDAGRLRTEARVSRVSVTDVDYASGGADDRRERRERPGRAAGCVHGVGCRHAGAAGRTGRGRDPGPRRADSLRRDPHRLLAPATMTEFDGWTLLDLRTGSRIRTGRLPESTWRSTTSPRTASTWPRGSSARSGLDRRHPHRATRGRPAPTHPYRSSGWAGPRTGHGSSPTTAPAPWGCGMPPPPRCRTP